MRINNSKVFHTLPHKLSRIRLISNNSLRGSISLYLALTLTVILSLFFCIIESARITSINARAKAITYMAMDSVFGGFALSLYEKYGLFGVFTTEDKFLFQLKKFAEGNSSPQNLSSLSSFNLFKSKLTDISINRLYHLTDNDGLIFSSQAIAFEKYRGLSEDLASINEMDKQVSENSHCKPAAIKDGDFVLDGNSISYSDLLKDSDSSLYTDYSPAQAANLKDGIVNKVINLLKSNLLLLFIDNPYSISPVALSEQTMGYMPSQVCTLSAEAQESQESGSPEIINAVFDKALFLSYIENSFSSYISNQVNPDISLKYQREYILGGHASDSDNLLSAALSLVSLRAALNLSYLISDSDKRGAALNLGNTICCYAPIASKIAAFIILSAWAYGEAILDVRDLFAGKKVPLIKNADSWTLSLEGILTLQKGTVSKNAGEQGYSYNDYINMSLLLISPYTVYYRAMDLIQLDMCENVNANFRMYSCICGADITASYSSRPIFTPLVRTASPNSYKYSINMVYGYD